MKRSQLSKALVATGISLAACLFPITADAATECAVTPLRFFVGEGSLWVVWVEGGAGVIFQSDPDFKTTLAAIMLAISTQKSVIVRYAADGVPCTSPQQEIAGLWVLR
jgi:hypothetical protein